MTTTMTYVGLDVHARSTHAAAIDVESGELRRARFGGGSEELIAWLQALPQPLKGCYEAGPTGFALYRAAEAVGLPLAVVAPSKTPRAPGERIKSDRKAGELLARLLLAGQLQSVTVPPPAVEAARHLARAREQVRGDLMRCRHRVSKLLLLHGRVYEGSAWTKKHRRWLEQQRFEQAATELAFLDSLAAVGGLVQRKAALDERLSRLAREGEWWPTVARLRCFRGIDTLSAFVLLPRGRRLDTLRPAGQARLLARARPLPRPIGRKPPPGRDHQDRLRLRPAAAGRGRLALPAPAERRPRVGRASGRPTRPRPPDRAACATAAPPPPPAAAPARQTGQGHDRRRRARTRLLLLGRRRGRLTPNHSRLLGRAPGHTLPARATDLWVTR